jgi:hypothetical protein
MPCKRKRCRIRKGNKMATNTLAVIAKHYPEQLPKAVAQIQASGSQNVTVPLATVLNAGIVGQDGSLIIDSEKVDSWKKATEYFGLWG